MENAKTFKVRKLTGDRFVPSESEVAIEKELPVYVNGDLLATASVVPSMEREFVVGYLFGQGFIDNAGEIAALEITDQGAMAILTVPDSISSRKTKTSYRIVSGGGRTAYFDTDAFPPIDPDFKIARKEIFRAMDTLFENGPLYATTGGVHSAALFGSHVNPICIAEDIGRHNTLDKVIGYALLNNVDRSRTFMVSTGRMASEMIMKICRAGIPLVATKTAVTDQGLDIAEKCGVTVIGFVRAQGSKMHTNMETRIFTRAQMKIYTGVERVL